MNDPIQDLLFACLFAPPTMVSRAKFWDLMYNSSAITIDDKFDEVILSIVKSLEEAWERIHDQRSIT